MRKEIHFGVIGEDVQLGFEAGHASGSEGLGAERGNPFFLRRLWPGGGLRGDCAAPGSLFPSLPLILIFKK